MKTTTFSHLEALNISLALTNMSTKAAASCPSDVPAYSIYLVTIYLVTNVSIYPPCLKCYDGSRVKSLAYIDY